MTGDNKKILWGIDLGGTKMEGAVIDTTAGIDVLFRERVSTGAEKGYSHILNQVKVLFDSMVKAVGYTPTKIGIGTPGILIPHSGLMKNCNATALNGNPVKRDLEEILNVSIEMANDANCFVLAETRLGVVKQKFPSAQVVFGVTLGTGVGGGLVIGDRVHNGYHGIGGEWGHNHLAGFEGRPCFCGKVGDNESILSGPSLEWYYEKESGVKKELKDIVALAHQGSDTIAVATLNRLTTGFAKAVSVIVNILDPDVIVVGGGVGTIDEIFTEGIPAIRQHVFNNEFQTPIVKPLLGDSAGVFGAALLTTTNTMKKNDLIEF